MLGVNIPVCIDTGFDLNRVFNCLVSRWPWSVCLPTLISQESLKVTISFEYFQMKDLQLKN